MRVAVVGWGGGGGRSGQTAGNIGGGGVGWGRDWRWIVDRTDIDLVIVSTANNAHAETSIGVMESGKHVICEKPLARNPKECQSMVEMARRKHVTLNTGFNH